MVPNYITRPTSEGLGVYRELLTTDEFIMYLDKLRIIDGRKYLELHSFTNSTLAIDCLENVQRHAHHLFSNELAVVNGM